VKSKTVQCSGHMDRKKQKIALDFTIFIVENRVIGSVKKLEDTTKVGLTKIYSETVYCFRSCALLW
jgi:hypothetical protein